MYIFNIFVIVILPYSGNSVGEMYKCHYEIVFLVENNIPKVKKKIKKIEIR
jgi:hypothetical protein